MPGTSMRWESSAIRRFSAEVLMVGLAIFHLYTGGFGSLPGTQQLAVHVGLVLIIVYLTYGRRGKRSTESRLGIWDYGVIGLIVFPAVIAFFSWRRWMISPSEMTPMDLISFAFVTLLVIEASQRLIGKVLNVVFGVVLLYMVLGEYIPGRFGHPGFGWLPILRSFGISGVWGWITSISARQLAVFLLFGGLLGYYGGAPFFIDIANAVAGRFRGGPALIAVVSSSLFGTCSGSAMANVITTGSVTIPLMKSMGYRSHFAGGVEAAASSGGQIMPPLMGAGAFIIAEMLGVRYWDVCLAALVPALMFYLSVFMGVLLEARRLNLQPLPRDKVVPLKTILTWQRLAPFVVPISVLVYFLRWRSIGFSGFAACMAIIVVHVFSGLSLVGIGRRIAGLWKGLQAGATAVVSLAPTIFVAGLIVNLVNFSGLGVKLSGAILSIGELIPLIAAILVPFFTGLVCIILGMGMPTTPSYVIAAAVAAPALLHFGFPEIAAHLFIFYFAILSGITPPVCTVAYTGAAVSEAPWYRVAWVSIRLAAISFFMPFLFLFYPALMLMGIPSEIVIVLLRFSIVTMCLAGGIWGWFINPLNPVERILMITGAFSLALPWISVYLPGIGLIAIAMVSSLVRRRMLVAVKLGE